MHQARGKRVARSHGIGNRDSEPGVLTPLAVPHQQAAPAASSEADQFQAIVADQEMGRGQLILVRQFSQAHDLRQFLVIEFDDVCQFHGFRKNFVRVIGLPQVDVEHFDRARLCSAKKSSNGGTAFLGPLRQRSKTHRIRFFRQMLPIRRPG